MRHATAFHRECTGVFATAFVLLSTIWAGVVAAGTPGSLDDAYKAASQLAATPQGGDEAMAGYQAIVEAHLANEAVFDSALKQLARQYMELGRIEEGIQFFLNLGQRMYGQQKPNTLKEILGQFKLKYPQQTEQAIAGLQSSSGKQITGIPAMLSRELAEAILQREDAELRRKALERLQAMLAAPSSDEDKKQGLVTLASVLTAKFDRKVFHDLALPLLASPVPEIRATALRCLPGLEAPVQDLDLVVSMAGDESPKVRREVGPALIQIGKGQEKDKVIPALMQLLQDKEPAIVEWTIRSMWGQYASPELDGLLIRLSRDPKLHHNVIYFGLSTMKSKSPAVCSRLVEELADPDWNNSGRAAWGLTYGVPDEAKSVVEDGLLKALPQETNDNTRKDEFRALGMVATEKSRGYLQSVVDSSQETDNAKQLAREVLARLRSTP